MVPAARSVELGTQSDIKDHSQEDDLFTGAQGRLEDWGGPDVENVTGKVEMDGGGGKSSRSVDR